MWMADFHSMHLVAVDPNVAVETIVFTMAVLNQLSIAYILRYTNIIIIVRIKHV